MSVRKIGIVGAGNLGTALAKRLRLKGHDVCFGEGDAPKKVVEAAAAVGVGHMPSAEIAHWADVVALTVPWAAVPDALASLGDLAGVVLWDCTNPLKPDLSGLEIGTTTSGGEEVQRLAPRARVVKGIPAFAELLHAAKPLVSGRPGGLFVAGDDADAKALVASLLCDLPAHVTDAGGLVAARFIEPACLLLVRLAYLQGLGPRISLEVIQ